MTVPRLGQQIDALRTHLGELTRLFAATSIEQEQRVSETLDELAVTAEALDMARQELQEHEAELAAAQAALRERDERIATLQTALAAARTEGERAADAPEVAAPPEPRTADVRREYDAQTARLIGDRLRAATVVYAVSFGLIWFVECYANPERFRWYGVTYGLEVAALGGAAWWMQRRSVPLRQCIMVAVLSIVAVVACITAYRTGVRGGEAEIHALAMVGIAVGAMVLFPWGGGPQVAVVAACLAGYLAAVAIGLQSVTPIGTHVITLTTIGALTVGSAAFLDRFRFGYVRQAAALRRTNAALAASNRALQEADRAKTEFLASISHELRTPLNVTMGYQQLLQEGTFGTLPDSAQEPLGRVLSSLRMLLALVNDFLDLSRLETRRLPLRIVPIELAPLCREVLSWIEPLVHGKPIALACDVPADAVALADAERLRQVLVNLLSNAAKFTERGRIALRARPEPDAIVLEVADTGVGIPAGEQAVIFEPFRRGSHAQRFGGVGIGLALSRQLAEAMGGTIAVASEPGAGATFAVRLRRPE
jgi:signal transduction histidine kinase